MGLFTVGPRRWYGRRTNLKSYGARTNVVRILEEQFGQILRHAYDHRDREKSANIVPTSYGFSVDRA